MNGFPAIDPIPLPAPVWLFKALHVLTLGLHFVAVEMLLGGLLVAVVLNLMGVLKRGTPGSMTQLNSASSIARRLPLVMTYVINLGVPPLLFSQVLYGRALYTSSVLIGAYWIAVVFLLMLCYWLLYRFAAAAEEGRAGWYLGLISWLVAGSIAKIYSTNMTLMLRPEVWNAMYSASGMGTHLPPHDPTTFVRWGFMMTGGLAIAGVWMIWLAGYRNIGDEVRKYLSGTGGKLAFIMILVQAFLAYKVFAAQPEAVRKGLSENSYYLISGWVWRAAAAVICAAGLWAAFRKPVASAAGWFLAITGTVGILGMTLYRDGIRDLTLASKGYDVWARSVAVNWSVLILFLVVFVAGLGAIGWLVTVMKRAKPMSEKIAL